MLVAMLLLMVTVLSSCGGAAQPTLSIDDDVYVKMEYDKDKDLKPSEIKNIAQMLTAAYSAEFDVQEYLIAASRGHNMLAEGFDPTVRKHKRSILPTLRRQRT